RPVLIAPGNRDPAVPSSPYRYLRWPENVTIAAHEELRAYPFHDVTVWAAGFTRPDVAEAPLRDATPVEGGHNLLLLHASDINQRRLIEEPNDITGMTSPEHVRQALQALRESKGLQGAVIRAVLTGERSRSLEMDPQALTLECGDGFAHLEFRDQSRIAHDVDTMAQKFTSPAQLARKLADRP